MVRSGRAASSPTVLFLGGLDGPDRNWTRLLSEKARLAGYRRVIEPCCGSFIISCVHRYAGWKPEQIEASDVSLFSAICGFYLTGQDLALLDYRKDGAPVPLTGDPLADAANLLYEQVLVRIELKGDACYWQELARDLRLRKRAHLESIAGKLQPLRAHLQGISFRPLDLFRHLDEVKDDPLAFVHVSPPTYKAGYEKLYNTQGRITWKEPSYTIFDPQTSQKQLAVAARSWKCLLVCLQEDAPGRAQETCVYARAVSRDKNLYFWTNQPEVVESLLGKMAVCRNLPAGGPMQHPTVGYDEPVTSAMQVWIRPLTFEEAIYYKDLWIHKIDPKKAMHQFAVMLDGKLAGIAGYDSQAILGMKLPAAKNRFPDALILTFATGAPHYARLTRLVTMLAQCRTVVEMVVPPWIAIQAQRLVTVEYTQHAEAKGNRGIMELVSRSKHPQRGNQLVYVANLQERSLQETLALWCEKENQWKQATTQPAKPSRRRPQHRSALTWETISGSSGSASTT